ncbi:hypothetical protein EDB81DRAFT_858327, partial [Dactylonectria macrodidyma]
MAREEKVVVPMAEIRRTIEHLDRRRAPNAVQRRPCTSPPPAVPPNDSIEPTEIIMRRARTARVPMDEVCRTIEDLDRQHARTRSQRDQERVIVPMDEIRRTIEDLDRRHAGNRAQRRREPSPPPAIPPSRSTTISTDINVLHGKKIKVPMDDIRRTMDDLDRRRAANTARRRRLRSRTPVIPAPVTTTPSDSSMPRISKVRVPLDEIRRTMEVMDRQRADAQVRQKQELPPKIFLGSRTDQTAPRPGRDVAQVSTHQVFGALHDLNRQHSEGPGGIIPETAPPTVAAERHEPLRVPLHEIRSTATDWDRQRWLDRQRQRSEAAQRRASGRPAQRARQQSEDRSTSESAADPEPPARTPAVRRARMPGQPAAPMVDVDPLPQPLIVPPPKKKRRLTRETIQ